MTEDTDRLVHRDDPESSFEAIERHDASGVRGSNREAVYAFLKGREGRTSREYAEEMPMDVHEVRRRLTDLLNDGLIMQGGSRKCSVANTKAVTWYPLPRRREE